MDILAVLLIVVVILLIVLLIVGFFFKLYTRDKSTKRVIIINRKNRTLNGTSQKLHAIPVKGVNKKTIIEPSNKQQRHKNNMIGSDNFRQISMPGYIPSETASDKEEKDQTKKSLSQDSELRRHSQVSLSNALPIPKEERRLSSAQMSELQLMDVGALPRDVASELEEKEKQKKGRQKWCDL